MRPPKSTSPLPSAATGAGDTRPPVAVAPSRRVLGMRVDHIEAPAAALIAGWSAAAPSSARYVCGANVHMTMVAHDDPTFKDAVNAADLVLPDGVPMVWALRALGLQQKRRVRVSTDLLREIIGVCADRHVKVGLYGGTPQTLAAMTANLLTAFPDLDLAFSHSPPFRPLTPEEDAAVVREIAASGVGLLLIGIGCPKQERWMAAHTGRLDCVMMGVGAAFDLLAGKTRNAPLWMRDRGLEWVYRLVCEPRRLWRRYLYHNPRFIVLFATQVLRSRHPAP